MYVFIWLEMIGGGIGGGDGRKGLYSAAAALQKKRKICRLAPSEVIILQVAIYIDPKI